MCVRVLRLGICAVCAAILGTPPASCLPPPATCTLATCRIRIQKINILRYVVYFKFKIDFQALTGTGTAAAGAAAVVQRPRSADSTTSLSECRNPRGGTDLPGDEREHGAPTLTQ